MLEPFGHGDVTMHAAKIQNAPARWLPRGTAPIATLELNDPEPVTPI